MLAKGLRYHAGAGTQFTGLCAIPPVRIPYDAKKIRTRFVSSYYFLWRSIREYILYKIWYKTDKYKHNI